MRGKYVAAVGFDGELVTEKGFARWKKNRNKKDIVRVGWMDWAVDRVPWYFHLPSPTPSPLFNLLSKRMTESLDEAIETHLVDFCECSCHTQGSDTPPCKSCRPKKPSSRWIGRWDGFGGDPKNPWRKLRQCLKCG